MTQSPTLKYGSKNWESTRDNSFSSVCKSASADVKDPELIEMSYFSYWKKYNADNDIDLSVIIQANTYAMK